jgi:hypothetical protein
MYHFSIVLLKFESYHLVTRLLIVFHWFVSVSHPMKQFQLESANKKGPIQNEPDLPVYDYFYLFLVFG